MVVYINGIAIIVSSLYLTKNQKSYEFSKFFQKRKEKNIYLGKCIE